MGKILEVIDKIVGVVIEQSPRWLVIVFLYGGFIGAHNLGGVDV